MGGIFGASRTPSPGLTSCHSGMNPVGVDNLATEQILQPGVAIESTAPLSDLGEPRPHAFGRRMDRDGPRGRRRSVGQHRIARQRLVGLLRGGAPAQEPGANRSRADEERAEAGEQRPEHHFFPAYDESEP